MRSRQVAIVTATLILAPQISANPIYADVRSPSPSVLSKSDSNAAYKEALDKYRNDLKVYEDKRREINKIFKDSIDKAMAESRANNLLNLNQNQKRQNMKAKQNAVIAASQARDIALAALGEAPISPTPPAKPVPNEKKNKQQPQNSPSPRGR